MNINLNESGQECLENILTQRDRNLQTSEWNNVFLNDYFDSVTVKDIKDYCSQSDCGEEEAYSQLFYSILGVDDEDPEIEEMRSRCSFGAIERLDPKLCLENAYWNNIHIPEIKLGRFTLCNEKFLPLEALNYEECDSSWQNDFAEKTHLGYFSRSVSYPAILEKNTIWMSVTPHEINTMKEAIDNAHGNVVTFGLGLGYYAYMVSLKDNVKSVTIVENNSQIISLFKRNILPQFSHGEKINIIPADAFSFFRKHMETNYDYAFIDIYHNGDDALPMYLKFKSMEKECHIGCECVYWIEKTILAYMRRYVLAILEEYYQGMTEEDYQDTSTEENKNIKSIYEAMKDINLETKEDLIALLSDQGLRNIAENTK